ncbi:MAG: hypothetical protein J6K76_01270 [Spirochaetaceae bacterium]|nr:hypothetical protein [Spirochaetaceae bacterium]
MKKLVRVSLFVLMALTLSIAIGCKHDSDPEPAPADVAGKNDSDPEQKPAPSNFVGEWKSTDGTTTVTVTSDGGFRTERTDMPEPFSGTYTVSSDGKTLTTSEITLPEDMGGAKVAFSMKLKDSETDVMDLPLSEIGMGDLVLVKVSTTEPNLDGTWTGQVVDEEGNLGNLTIVFANNNATLTLPWETGVVTAPVTQDGNFFTITATWTDDPEGNKLTGLISASDKAWLDDGSVFTKQQ